MRTEVAVDSELHHTGLNSPPVVCADTIVVGMVITLPARVAYQWLSLPDVALSGLHGTVWKGKADAANVRGVYLEDLTWHIKPLQLFLGKAAYERWAQEIAREYGNGIRVFLFKLFDHSGHTGESTYAAAIQRGKP